MKEHFVLPALLAQLLRQRRRPWGTYASVSWNNFNSPLEWAKAADAAFEFITKLSLPYYCFHDTDGGVYQ